MACISNQFAYIFLKKGQVGSDRDWYVYIIFLYYSPCVSIATNLIFTSHSL